MIIKKEEKEHIKQYKSLPKSILEKYLIDLREDCLHGELKPDEREVKVRVYQEIERMLKIFDLIDQKETKKKRDNYV